jgi:hypothetical protein
MGRLPRLSHSLDLLRWRPALPGGHIVSNMLQRDLDALAPVRDAMSNGSQLKTDDSRLVLGGLARLHRLLYQESKLPADKSGLSRRIRELLTKEGLQ